MWPAVVLLGVLLLVPSCTPRTKKRFHKRVQKAPNYTEPEYFEPQKKLRPWRLNKYHWRNTTDLDELVELERKLKAGEKVDYQLAGDETLSVKNDTVVLVGKVWYLMTRYWCYLIDRQNNGMDEREGYFKVRAYHTWLEFDRKTADKGFQKYASLLPFKTGGYWLRWHDNHWLVDTKWGEKKFTHRGMHRPAELLPYTHLLSEDGDWFHFYFMPLGFKQYITKLTLVSAKYPYEYNKRMQVMPIYWDMISTTRLKAAEDNKTWVVQDDQGIWRKVLYRGTSLMDARAHSGKWYKFRNPPVPFEVHLMQLPYYGNIKEYQEYKRNYTSKKRMRKTHLGPVPRSTEEPKSTKIPIGILQKRKNFERMEKALRRRKGRGPLLTF